MAVSFNGPLKITRPGYSTNGSFVNSSVASDTPVPNRQAWFAAVPVQFTILAPDNGTYGFVLPAGAQITSIHALNATTSLDAAATSTFTWTTGAFNASGQIVYTTNTITSGAFGTQRYNDVIATSGTSLSGVEADNLANVGVADVSCTVSNTSAVGPQKVYWTIEYIPRNQDGSLGDEGYRP
jgi:hypothetical protein